MNLDLSDCSTESGVAGEEGHVWHLLALLHGRPDEDG
jgi:hypothetical protein